jgi:hypothetical protein
MQKAIGIQAKDAMQMGFLAPKGRSIFYTNISNKPMG